MRKRYVTPEAEHELFKVSQIFYEGVLELMDELYADYRDKLWNTGPSDLALATQGVIAHSTEWAKAVVAAYQRGAAHAADGMLRVLLEGLVNLLYINYAGPKLENRTAESLASQFLAFGDADHLKLMNKRGGAMKRRIEETGRFAGRRFSIREFDELQTGLKERVTASERKFSDYLPQDDKGRHYFGRRWHRENFERMTELALENLPTWFTNADVIQTLYGAITTWNTNIHSSSFNFTREKMHLTKESFLKYQDGEKPNAGHVAGMILYSNWLIMADHFGDRERVEQMANANWERLAEPIVSKHTKPLMWRVAENDD